MSEITVGEREKGKLLGEKRKTSVPYQHKIALFSKWAAPDGTSSAGRKST